jgi:hypothetical protein
MYGAQCSIQVVTMMQDIYEEMVDLYEQLEVYRKRRGQILTYGLYYLMCVALVLSSLRLLRVALEFFLFGILLMLVIGAGIGLALLSQYIKNEVYGQSIKRDLERAKAEHKRKREEEERDDPAYDIGADGELIDRTDGASVPRDAQRRSGRERHG